MTDTQIQKGHPRGLYLLFFTEMWERFSYYGMRALFVLFMTKALLMTNEDASNIYGNYTGLVYLTPLLGGYLSDRYWGNRKSIFLGGILMAIGQFLMFISASFHDQQALAITMMWAGLTTLIVGNGFFKPNISTMVGQLYTKEDTRVDSAFTIFYMGVNLGAFFSPLICGSLGDTGDPADFKWGFLAACIGMIVSLISFELLKKKYVRGLDGQAIGTPVRKSDLKVLGLVIGCIALIFFLFNFVDITQWIFGLFNAGMPSWLARFDLIFWLVVIAFAAVFVFFMMDKSLDKIERDRIIVIFVLAFFVIFFWSAFEQAGASLTIFADQNVNRDVPFSLNKWLIFIILSALLYSLSKFLEWFFEWKKNTHLIISAIGIVLFLGLVLIGKITTASFENVPASWFQSVNPFVIVTFAPIVSWLWAQLGNKQPSAPTKMAFGLLFVALGFLLIAFGVKGVDSTVKISMLWLVGMYFLHTIGELCLSPIGQSMVAKLSPLRFSSLLMGTWFMANAIANKVAGMLSSMIPPGAGEHAATASGTAEYKSLFGYQITNLYEFFIVFIGISGIAAIILFFLSKKLMKMMHGIR
ncbi:MAG: peptide MFS transporter [Flavobacteriaceae bacterium]|jgi:POT family proton-dependent oligopeptide transporter|nr:peptide MFS transporter [Flavobacteriaceae bacterium]